MESICDEKNSPFLTFNSIMNRILSYRAEIYGICAIWIMLFHISDRVPVPLTPHVITPLIRMGNCCVDIFMFLSAYCICLSWEKDSNLLNFYKKRLVRIIPSYIVLSCPFYFWKYRWGFCASETFLNFDWIHFLADMSTITFWLKGMQTTWFVAAILVFYLLFPLFYKVCGRNLFYSLFFLAFIYFVNLVVIEYFNDSYKKFGIALARLPAFLLGLIVCQYREKISVDSKVFKIAKFCFEVFFICFAFLFPLKETAAKSLQRYFSGVTWMGYAFLIPGYLVLFCLILSRKKDSKIKRAIQILGGGTLELYMIHVYILRITDFYYPISKIGYLSYLLIFAASFLIYAFFFICRNFLITRILCTKELNG